MKGHLVKKQEYQSGSVHLVIVVALIFALIGVLGFVFWQNYSKLSGTTKTSSINKKNKTVSNDSKSIAVADVSTADGVVKGAYDVITNKYTSNVTKITLDFTITNTPAYKPNGVGYYIGTKSGAALKVALNASYDTVDDYYNNQSKYIDPILVDIRAFLTSHGFENITGYPDGYYSSSSVVCLTGAYPELLECANTADYESAVTTLTPLVQAYVASNPSVDISKTVFSFPTISSAVSGYQTAMVSIGPLIGVGGAGGLFYKKDGGSWKYFKSTQAPLQCSDYNTDELKAAYKGDTCYSSSIRSVVE
jgi:hypothetical protein